MDKKHSYNQEEASEPEELEDDPELKELGDEDLEETENPKGEGENGDDISEDEEEDEVPETE